MLHHLAHSGYVSFVLLVGTIFVVLEAMVLVVQLIRRDPQDRVLLFEALAIGSFVFGLPLIKVLGLGVAGFLICLILSFGFTGCAAYCGISASLARRKQRRA